MDTPVVGAGMTQWGTSKWRSLIGFAGNAGLLIGAFLMIRDGSWIGWVWLAMFALAAIVPIAVWKCRMYLNPYHGVQLVFAVTAIAWTTALTSAVLLRPDLLIKYSAEPASARQEWLMDKLTQNPKLALVALLLFPFIGIWYHLVEIRSRRTINQTSNAG